MVKITAESLLGFIEKIAIILLQEKEIHNPSPLTKVTASLVKQTKIYEMGPRINMMNEYTGVDQENNNVKVVEDMQLLTQQSSSTTKDILSQSTVTLFWADAQKSTVTIFFGAPTESSEYPQGGTLTGMVVSATGDNTDKIGNVATMSIDQNLSGVRYFGC
jgi:hypothetical protein